MAAPALATLLGPQSCRSAVHFPPGAERHRA